MPTETSSKFYDQSWHCRWLLEFTKPRNFHRESENQTYIEFLQTRIHDGDDDDDDDDNASNDDENEVDEDNRHSIVRLFMRGLEGDEDTLQYHDQVEQVANFFEQASYRDLKRGLSGKSEKHVALLDDRNHGGSIREREGYCRRYQGPLTSQQLRNELSRKRFRVESGHSIPTNAFESDAERRLIFITDLDAPTMEALTVTASRSQAPALRDLLYKYLMRKTSIGVNIRSKGFRVFNLDFHIPYYVLRVGKEMLKDPRKSGGMPLRRSLDFPLLSRSMNTSASTDKSYFLYEAQISVAVIGIDHWVWTAYCFVDTYFESDKKKRESVDRYHQVEGRSGRADPLAAGQIDASLPIWTPREYFLRVLEIRIKLISREYHDVVAKVENEIRESRTHHVFPLSSNNPKSRKELRDFSTWNTQMVKLLRQLISGLSDIAGAWEEFKRKDIGYFLNDGDSPTSSLPSVAAIDKVFSQLNGLLRRLNELRNEFCEDYPQGLHAYLSLENNESAMFQQRTASHIQVLTVITIVFYPLVLTMSLFSTQGVLPFTPTLEYFTYAFLILSFLVVVTLVALFNWNSWFQPVADSVTAVFHLLKSIIIPHQGQKIKADEDHDEQPNVEGRRALELRRSTPLRHRNSRALNQWDLEQGIELGRVTLRS